MTRSTRSLRRRSRGAAALEAALVTPLVMLLAFGVIEFALLMKDDVALTSAVRAGGRIASANPGAGGGGLDENGQCVTPCSPASVPKFAQLAANAIQSSGSALPKDSITDLWIYKANNKGFPGADNNTTFGATCPANCVRYKWVPSQDQFRYRDGTWAHREINACATTADSVGVYMVAKHAWVTGLFGRTITIDDHAVFTFEPLPTLTCAPNTRS